MKQRPLLHSSLIAAHLLVFETQLLGLIFLTHNSVYPEITRARILRDCLGWKKKEEVESCSI